MVPEQIEEIVGVVRESLWGRQQEQRSEWGGGS
jgi:hypothetical protein